MLTCFVCPSGNRKQQKVAYSLLTFFLKDLKINGEGVNRLKVFIYEENYFNFSSILIKAVSNKLNALKVI